jgi:iron only hydrogenase large subunit-like protein
MRDCPTQAIRIIDKKAHISEELCVDCGTCFSVCPASAIKTYADPIEGLSRFKYKVVVPAGVLYSQFESTIHPYIIHLAFKELGFDAVVDINVSSVTMTVALKKYLEKYSGRRPLISSHCPSMLRLIQVKYPDLVELIVPLDVPREITARDIRTEFPQKLGLKPEDIGIIYIAPCPAKIVSIKQPAEKTESWFDGVLSITDVYSLLHPHVVAIKENFDEKQVPDDFSFNTGWANLGGVSQQFGFENWLSVNGLNNVMKILDDIENSRLRNIDFVEAMACMLSCLGGPFNVENPYVARSNSIQQKNKYDTVIEIDEDDVAQKLDEGYYFFENPILPRPTKYFDTDLVTSIKRIRESERIYMRLPQIDCGCCGAPTCKAFAEDVVRGDAELTDCILLAQG